MARILECKGTAAGLPNLADLSTFPHLKSPNAEHSIVNPNISPVNASFLISYMSLPNSDFFEFAVLSVDPHFCSLNHFFW
jgi:hypothetical protein